MMLPSHENVSLPSAFDKIIESLRYDLSTRLNEDIENLETTLAFSKNQQHQEYMKGMIKVNRSVKVMKVSEFNATYRCDLLQYAQKIKEVAAQLLSSAGHGAGVKRDRQGNEVAIDLTAKKHFNPKLATPSRTVRPGETM
jgi:hypothetical protein